jgi:ABC-type glutathione transport system ATPase component
LKPASRCLWEHVWRLHADHGVTVFLTTHYLDEADALCDGILVIDDGEIVAEGSPDSLTARVSDDGVTIGWPAEFVAAVAEIAGNPRPAPHRWAEARRPFARHRLRGAVAVAGRHRHPARRGDRAPVDRPGRHRPSHRSRRHRGTARHHSLSQPSLFRELTSVDQVLEHILSFLFNLSGSVLPQG